MSSSSVTTLSSSSLESNRILQNQKAFHYCIYCNRICSIENYCNCTNCILQETKQENTQQQRMIRLETKRLNIIKSSFDNDFKFKPIKEQDGQRNDQKVILLKYYNLLCN